MSFQIVHSHWLMAALLLFIAQVFITRLAIFNLPYSAILVAVLLIVLPELTLRQQLLIFASAAFLFSLWGKFIRPRIPGRAKADMPQDPLLNTRGVVIKSPNDEDLGIVRFPDPLWDKTEWPFFCEQAVQPGEQVVLNLYETYAFAQMRFMAYEKDMGREALKGKKIDTRTQGHGTVGEEDPLEVPKFFLMVTKAE